MDSPFRSPGPGGRRRKATGKTALIGAAISIVALLSAFGPSPVAGLSPSSAPSGSSSAAAASASPGASEPAAIKTPTLAYFYIWFNTASWTHDKTDVPSLGAYTSTNPGVIKQQVTWAKEAGIDAFIVSWKATPALNVALSELVAECRSQGLKLVLLYQGLDVNRNPIPVATVQSDLLWFESQYGSDPVFDVYGKPAIVWSGTWRFSATDMASVRDAIHAPSQVLLLGSDRSAAEYTAHAGIFDGDAYYWSSADPLSTPGYAKRLTQLGAAVHSSGGLWLAPAAAGFDARLNGGTSVVDRRNGATLTAAWTAALATAPDGVAVISWNEFTENSHIEPSKSYGQRYMKVLSLLTGAPGPGSGKPAPTATPTPTPPPSPSVAPTASPDERVAGATGGPLRGTGPSDLVGSLLGGAAILAILAVLGWRLRHAARGRGPGASGRADAMGRPAR